jgi:hypothetical protein
MEIDFSSVWLSEARGLLVWINRDIEEKYDIENPQFIVCRNIVEDREKIIDWMARWMGPRGSKWVMYKHVQDDIFELKEYFPNPPDQPCFKEINELINFRKDIHKESFLFIVNDIVYTPKEAYSELLFEMRMGESWPLAPGPIKDPNPNKKRVIYNLNYNADEYGRTIPKGYQLLEKK